MLLLPGHGAVATTGSANRATARTKAGPRILAAHEVCGFATRAEMDAAGPRGRFAYFFPGAAHFPQGPASIARLDALADQMVVPRPGAPTTTTIPRVFTFFGQFIDHDITANTDRDGDLSKIDPEHGGAFAPLARDQVARELENLRAGALNLDSLHGGGPVQGAVAQMFDDALRFPADRAKLWAGVVSHVPGQVVPKPADPADLARDLLRLGRVVSGPHAPLDEAFFRGLPPDARAHFLDAAGHIRPSVAFIADARNDENLVIAQFHLAMLRLHNRIVDHARQDPTAPVRDREALFAWARRQVSWIYQWLVLNAFLPAVCDPAVLRDVNRNGPLLYDALIAHNRPPAAGLLPLPLEFSAAAFRFGHSMIRGDDDWNRFHGRGGAGAPATLGDLFANTGGAAVPFGGLPHLPSHWPVEWDRFVEGSPARYPDWSAMPIDTSLTPTLGALPGRGRRPEPPDAGSLRRATSAAATF